MAALFLRRRPLAVPCRRRPRAELPRLELVFEGANVLGIEVVYHRPRIRVVVPAVVFVTCSIRMRQRDRPEADALADAIEIGPEVFEAADGIGKSNSVPMRVAVLRQRV